MKETFYVILDGGFVTRKLHPLLGHKHATALDVELFVKSICDELGDGMKRAFWYGAEPLSTKAVNPISSQAIDFGKTAAFRRNTKLLSALEELENFAVRRGRLSSQGWRLTGKSLRALKQKTTQEELCAEDLEPNIGQKGVDMKIGIDIARIAFKKTADSIVIVSGDADLVPAMKLARIEGVRVYLHCMGHSVNRELKIHADKILNCQMVP